MGAFSMLFSQNHNTLNSRPGTASTPVGRASMKGIEQGEHDATPSGGGGEHDGTPSGCVCVWRLGVSMMLQHRGRGSEHDATPSGGGGGGGGVNLMLHHREGGGVSMMLHHLGWGGGRGVGGGSMMLPHPGGGGMMLPHPGGA